MQLKLASILFQQSTEPNSSIDNLQECESLIENLLKNDPQNSDILHLYGKVKHKQNKLDEATEVFEREIKAILD